MIASALIALSFSTAPAEAALLVAVTVRAPQEQGRERQKGKGSARDEQQRGGEGKGRGARGKKDDAGAGRTRRGAARDTRPPGAIPYRPPADNRPVPGKSVPERPPAQLHQHPPGSNKPSRVLKPFEPTEEARRRLAELPEKQEAPEPVFPSKEEVLEEGTTRRATGAIRIDIEQTRAIALEQKKHRERLARIHRLITLAGLLERNDSHEALASLQQDELDRHERVLASWRAKIGEHAVHRALRIADGH